MVVTIIIKDDDGKQVKSIDYYGKPDEKWEETSYRIGCKVAVEITQKEIKNGKFRSFADTDQLDTTSSVKKREAIGGEVIHRIQDENAIIFLAPRYDYMLSNLYIVPSPEVCFQTEFVLNIPQMIVTRFDIQCYLFSYSYSLF